jgi:hypothetical protein
MGQLLSVSFVAWYSARGNSQKKARAICPAEDYLSCQRASFLILLSAVLGCTVTARTTPWD